MKKRALGRTGITLPELGMGCWAISGIGYGPVTKEMALGAITAAWESGVRFFDTADCYGEGESELRLASFFKAKPRSDYLIATKSGWDFYHGGHKKNFDAQYIEFACNQSLKRLETDYIDLYQLHNPSIEVLKRGDVWQAVQALKREGKVRFAGVSLHSVEEALWVVQNLNVDAIQVIYNILDQRMRYQVFSAAKAKGIGVIVREPLASGILSGKYPSAARFDKKDHRSRFSSEKMAADAEKIKVVRSVLDCEDLILPSLAFALSEQAVSCVIPGVKNNAQALFNFGSGRHLFIEEATVKELQRLFDGHSLFREQLIPSDK